MGWCELGAQPDRELGGPGLLLGVSSTGCRADPASLHLCPADFSGSLMMGQPLSSSPPWESALVGKIRAMSGLEKNLVLEAVCRCIQEQNQVGSWGPSSPTRRGSAHWPRLAHWGIPAVPAIPGPLTSWCV